MKKRKLNSSRRSEFDEAVAKLTHFLDDAERSLAVDGATAELQRRQAEHKVHLDQLLKTGHILIEELQNGEPPPPNPSVADRPIRDDRLFFFASPSADDLQTRTKSAVSKTT